MTEADNGNTNKKQQIMLTIIIFLGILVISGIILLAMLNQTSGKPSTDSSQTSTDQTNVTDTSETGSDNAEAANTHGRMVRVVQGNVVLYTIDLDASEDRSFEVKSVRGYNTVTIKDHEISVTESDCPDKVCVGMGNLQENYLPIVCLPHELYIEFVDE